MIMKNKFIKYIKNQLNIDLTNDKSEPLNNKIKILYTEIKKEDINKLLSFLQKNNFRYEHHIGYCYWIWVCNWR